MANKLAHWLVRQHRLGVAIAIIAIGLALPLSRQLRLDWQVEGMFAAGDPLVKSYRHLQERFSGNDICLVVYRDPGLWDDSGAGLERLGKVSQQLSQVEGVEAVLSLAELHSILQKIRGPLNLLSQNLSVQGFSAAVQSKPSLLDAEDRLAQAFAGVFEGYTHRRESEYVAIACLLTSSSEDLKIARGPVNSGRTLDRIREIMSDLPAPAVDGFVTGEPVLVAEGFKMVERDGKRLGITSAVLVSVVLLLCFRSVRWTLIPLLVVHWSLLVTQAVLVVCKLDLTMISSTLTAIVTVIGVATSIHLLLKFQERRRKGDSRPAAMQATLAVLIVPVFWACVTDAVGFSALMIASVGPVRDFGLMMAIGSMAVFVAILMLVPGLALLGTVDADPSLPKLDFAIRHWLRRALDSFLAFRTIGLSLFVIALGVAILGSRRMEVETDFTKNFSQDSPVIQGYEIIENELGGAGVWDIMLAAPGSIGSDYIQQVLQLEKELRAIEVQEKGIRLKLTKVLSIADAIEAADADALLAAVPVSARLQGMRAAMPEFTGALLTRNVDPNGYRWLRIMLRSKEQVNASVKNKLVDRVKEKVRTFTQKPEWKSLFDKAPPMSEVAGYHVMLGKLVASVLRDQWRCFFAATVGIFVVLVLATRSLGFGLAALLPNALPIMLVLGGMGWMGIRANMGVAMIAAVSLGLSVDSSIHYLLHYQRRLKEGASQAKALRSAQENVGLAAILSTIALMAGFLTLCLSEFVPTVVFGILTSLTMLGGLLGNLVLLPLLIAPWKSK